MVTVLCGGVIVSSLLCLVSAQSDNCGTSVSPLVTRGTPIGQGEYPWLAALYKLNETGKWEQFCDGALLSPRIVLTAAHCLMSDTKVFKPENIKVGLGKMYRDFYHNEDHATIANVIQVVVHHRLLGFLSRYSFDVGLLKLSTPVELSDYIRPACLDLDTTTRVVNGATVHAAGWGTDENGTSTDIALAADLSYLDYEACLIQSRERYRNYITHDKICALSTSGMMINRGDGGTALTSVSQGRHYLVGVLSNRFTLSSLTLYLFTDLKNEGNLNWLRAEKNRLDSSH